MKNYNNAILYIVSNNWHIDCKHKRVCQSSQVVSQNAMVCYFICAISWLHNRLGGWVFGFYGKSTIVGYLMPNHFLSK